MSAGTTVVSSGPQTDMPSDGDSDIEILEMEDNDDAATPAETAEDGKRIDKPAEEEEGEEDDQFWQSLPVIDSRPIKKKKKKRARPAQ